MITVVNHDWHVIFLQCTLFPSLELAICEAESAVDCDSCLWFYARAEKQEMWIGFFSGLLIDIQFGTVLGLYALIYLMIGYVNGLFSETYFDETSSFVTADRRKRVCIRAVDLLFDVHAQR